MFVADKPGVIRVFKDGALLPTPFISLSAAVISYFNRGMLGMTGGRMFAHRGLVAVAVGAAFVLAAMLPGVASSEVVATNLLQNPGFEEDRTGWNFGFIVTSPVHSGTKALQISASSSGAKTSIQMIAVTGGTAYQASGWIKVASLAGGARILIQWRDSSSTILRTDSIGTKLTGTADWTQPSALLTAPASATQARFTLRVEPESDNSGQAWFDDLSFGSPSSLSPDFVQDVVVRDLVAPTDVAFLPDGRILIAEHRGLVKVYDNGSVTTFLDIRSRVNNFGERGLLGLAVDPSFTLSENNYVYLYYVYENDPAHVDAPKTVRLSRFTVSGGTADPTSELVLVGKESVGSCNNLPAGADCIPSDSRDHHGGTIRFASDGTVFFSTGDGAASCCVNDNALRAQNLDSLAGKVLHVTRTGAGLPGNPFWNGDAASNRSKVWAYGLRNPFRFGLRPGNDRPYIGDVGWKTWEEIDSSVAGSNFGWPCYEGPERQPGYEPRETCQALYAQGSSAVAMPLIAYAHGGTGASVTGGVFYTGTAFPQEYQGVYFYGDYALGWIRYVRFDASDSIVARPTDFMTAADGPVDIEVAPDGALMYLSINSGELRRIRYAPGNQPPTAHASATPTNGSAPLTVQFSSAGSNDPDDDTLSFSWDFGDGSPPTSEPSPQHEYVQNGTYEAVLTVVDGGGEPASDRVTITVGNTAPAASIDQPSPTFQYVVGGTVDLVGSAVDPEDGALSGDSLSWNITIQHCPGGACHTHPFLTTTGTEVSFQVPDHGDDSFFEISLTATDSEGLSDTASMTIHPQMVEIRLDSVPIGLSLVYDGEAATAPFSRLTAVNSTHAIHAPSPQGNATFVSWSDGGAQQHDVVVGDANAAFTATFAVASNLLQNPGFEEDRTGWNFGSIVTSPVHSGNKALQISASSSGAKTSIQMIAVTGGTAYQASGWIKVANLAGGARILITWRDSSGTLLRTDSIGTKLTGTADWTQPSASLTAPRSATQARFVLRVEPESDNAGQAWFDDLSFGSGT